MFKTAKGHLKSARDIAANAESAARDLTSEERKQINELSAKARESMNAEKAQAKARRDLDDLGRDLEAGEAEQLNAAALKGTHVGDVKRSSVGERFVKSASFKSLQERFPSGNIPRQARVSMDAVQVDGMKALITTGQATAASDASASVLVEPQKLGLVPYPFVAPTMRSVITNGTTGSDRIEYAQLLPDNDPANVVGAKGVKESPDITGTVGVKPQSSFGFRKASAEVITVAHWIPVTKQALSDAAQIRTMIDGFLSRGLETEIERMIIEGDKDAPTKGEEEWDGIFNTSGIQHQAFDKDIYRTARKAISKVTTLGGQVSAFLVSPELDEELDLMQDQTGRFYGAGPFRMGPNTLWGRPRIVVPALAGKSQFITGDLSQMVLWDREQATLTATDSHADFFIRNLVAILAECRAGFGILNPSLIVTGEEQAV